MRHAVKLPAALALLASLVLFLACPAAAQETASPLERTAGYVLQAVPAPAPAPPAESGRCWAWPAAA